jgi:hypothetical protein
MARLAVAALAALLPLLSWAAPALQIQTASSQHVQLPFTTRLGNMLPATGAHRIVEADRARIAHIKKRALRKKLGPRGEGVQASGKSFPVTNVAVCCTCRRLRAIWYHAHNVQVSYIASVTVNNQGPYGLIIDTGSSNTWVGADKSYEPSTVTGLFEVSYGSGTVIGYEVRFSFLSHHATLSDEYLDQGHRRARAGRRRPEPVHRCRTLCVRLFGRRRHPRVSIHWTEVRAGLTAAQDRPDRPDGRHHDQLQHRADCHRQPVQAGHDQHRVHWHLLRARDQRVICEWRAYVRYVSRLLLRSVNELSFWLGGVDKSKITGSVSYTPLTTTSPASEYWGIDQTLSYGGSTILEKTAGIVDTVRTAACWRSATLTRRTGHDAAVHRDRCVHQVRGRNRRRA